MKNMMLLTLMLSAVISFGRGLYAQEEKDQKVHQTKCPIMGGDINKDVFVDYEGKRIYFCCKGCPEKFEKSPSKYLEMMTAQGITLMDAPKLQTTCPVMGGKIDKSVFVDYNGDRIYFCCKGCPDKFKKEPTKYLAKLKEEGITLQKTPKPQVTCPVMGGKIDQKVYVDYQGKRIYFCCKGCPEKFLKNPDKYVVEMEKKGITLEAVPKVKEIPKKSGEGVIRHNQHDDGELHEKGHHDEDAHHGKKQHQKGCGGGGCGGGQ